MCFPHDKCNSFECEILRWKLLTWLFAPADGAEGRAENYDGWYLVWRIAIHGFKDRKERYRVFVEWYIIPNTIWAYLHIRLASGIKINLRPFHFEKSHNWLWNYNMTRSDIAIWLFEIAKIWRFPQHQFTHAIGHTSRARSFILVFTSLVKLSEAYRIIGIDTDMSELTAAAAAARHKTRQSKIYKQRLGKSKSIVCNYWFNIQFIYLIRRIVCLGKRLIHWTMNIGLNRVE